MKSNDGMFILRAMACGLLLMSGTLACSPKVYVIDRQTVFEEEASGQWPDFEKQLLERNKKKGPGTFSKVAPSRRREQLLTVLNGDLAVTGDEAEAPSEKKK